MTLLSKDTILGADDRKWEDIPVPEWGGDVRLLGLSGSERDAYEASMVVIGSNGKFQRANLADARAKLLSKAIVGEDFERLFTDRDIKALGGKNGAILERLYQEARKLSGLGKDQTEAKAGNSEAAPSGSSTSD